jgi:hypothetical protein
MLSSTTSARIDSEPVAGLLEALDPHLSREGVRASAHSQDLLRGPRLKAPVRQRQVAEGLRCEQPVRCRPGLEEPDQVRHRHARLRPGPDLARRGHDCAPVASRFFSTTAMVDSRSAVGLNSTIDVLAVISGR